MGDKVFFRAIIGTTRINVCNTKNRLYSTLNGSQLFESRTINSFTTEVLPVLSLIVSNEVKKNKSNVRLCCFDGSQNADVLNQFIGDLEAKGITVIKEELDEITENSPKDKTAAQSVPVVINKYRSLIKACSTDVSDCIDLSKALLSTNFPKTMWGVQGVQKVIASIIEGVSELEPALSKFEILTERSEKRLSYLQRGITANVFVPGSKEVVTGLVEDYSNIKELLGNLSQTLAHLSDIDKVFKKNTGYPTTWFFNSSTFYDFVYSFNNLINDFINMAASESGTLKPLSAWINTGDKHV